MPFIEAPTTFYLGRAYDPRSKRVTDDVVYYDSRDLTTHAVVVGMTGSGKTGLCINLLEEAILDGIPSIIVDPKGDITNLMLNFPDLRPQDFEPWVNIDDAMRAGMDVPKYAADVAHQWKQGLASWGIVQDRMRWLQFAAKYSIYTPGSDAGLPVSILASLRAPRDGFAADVEGNRERINGIVTALLALAGRDSQPVQDKDHVLVANIFEYAWARGVDLTLEDIIIQVQNPPFDKLGVFDVDSYISERDRRKLAMELNSIIAAPSFQSWVHGEPMDIQNLLYQRDGRPKVSIFYIAHLNETERMFMLTLLLENLLGWMRTQSGTTSLRALMYIDEMFGYFPPHPYNPPTKEPILRLLKQARAFGLGMILSTQNPGDLDYKGLTNAGTWFIGRLQSDNDKQKMIAGLESMATTSNQMNLEQVKRLISDIPPRVFLMHNVHDQAGPIMLHTRWAMSYLRGPLTRQQISLLMANQKAELAVRMGAASRYLPPTHGPQQPASAPPPPPPNYTGFGAQMVAAQQTFAQQNPNFNNNFAAPPPTTFPGAGVGVMSPPSLPEMPPASGTPPTQPPAPVYQTPTPMPAVPSSTQPPGAGGAVPAGFNQRRPPVPSSVPEYFLPFDIGSQQAVSQWQQRTGMVAQSGTGAVLAYRPYLLAQASARYSDRKASMYVTRVYAYLLPDLDQAIIHWDDHEINPIDTRSIMGEPNPGSLFGDVPSSLTDSKRLTQLKRELTDLIYNTKQLRVPQSTALSMVASPDGDFADFRAQLQQSAREKRDQEMDELTQKYEKIIDKLEEEQERKLQRRDNEKRELASHRREHLFTTGEAVLGLLNGRTAFTLSRMARSNVFKERSRGELELIEYSLQQLEEEKAEAVSRYEKEVQQINEKWAKAATNLEEYVITPYKKDISVELMGIGWIPNWYMSVNGQTIMMPAMSINPG